MGRPPLAPGQHGRVSLTRTLVGTAPWSARCRVRDAEGTLHQVRATGATAAAARSALDAALAERTASSSPAGAPAATGTASGPSSGPASGPVDDAPLLAGVEATVTVADLAQTWLDSLAGTGVRPGTRDLYRRSVAAHVVPRLGFFKVRLLNAAVVDRWFDEVRSGSGAASAKTARTCLRGMLSIAEREQVVTGPLDVVPRPRVASASSRPLRPAEEARLRAVLADPSGAGPAAADPLAADLVLFLLETGCRVGEALALTWDRVHLQQGVERVRVTATVERVAGQPTAARERADDDGRRDVPLPPLAVELLLRRRRARRRRHHLVFPSRTGTVRDPANTAKRLRRFFDAAGLAGVVTHDLRSTRQARPLDADAAPSLCAVSPFRAATGAPAQAPAVPVDPPAVPAAPVLVLLPSPRRGGAQLTPR